MSIFVDVYRDLKTAPFGERVETIREEGTETQSEIGHYVRAISSTPDSTGIGFIGGQPTRRGTSVFVEPIDRNTLPHPEARVRPRGSYQGNAAVGYLPIPTEL